MAQRANDPEFDEMLAASLDAEVELLPFLPELFRDLEDLGARAVDVVKILEPCALAGASRVLDLGCGKGAAALAVARQYGAHVRGFDGVDAFVEHAGARAQAQSLAELCAFQLGDVREVALLESGYDVVMLLAMGPLFGDASETVGTLRRCVKPGGYILLDDAYLAASAEMELEYCFDYATTCGLLTAWSDSIVAERVIDTADDHAWYAEMTGHILRRARVLAGRYPEHAEALLAFAERQRSETELLSGPVVGALWLLKTPT